ncbi:SRPBCC family protein [Saxibacter everestensis]|uniref:SRPBCC family protein n=1 Tax=Saxibacter everestensis TaxID=2909229 RepID=A0ABY8QQU6_9MICO|nr:SRPBCC family protein [Brevibacteriaceae bacterium ZFBP1038]
MSTNPVTITVPEGGPFIEIVREFDAPVDAVYRAHATPELVKKWLGPNGYEMEIEYYDVRTGGRYRYTHRNGEGEEFVFNGVFHTARPNELIIQTFEYEDFPDAVSIETLRFEELPNGRTRLVGHSVYPNQEARDGMAASGMEQGVREGYERLDEILGS